MESISKIVMVIAVLLSSVSGFAQIKNTKTETVKIYGNCSMCKTTIEQAGNVKNTAIVAWNKETKLATLTYDEKKTSQDEILKRIALAGYDSEKYLAPDDVYANLPGCCQYDRTLKPVSIAKAKTITADAQNVPQLKVVLDNYFSVKDGLVKTDAGIASAKATALLEAIKAVEMTKLSNEEHAVWMEVLEDLLANAAEIARSKDVAKQREAFVLLSKNVYGLATVSKSDVPVYHQHCPMYNNGTGANWLSKEEGVKNPYYGSQMLTCGSTIETIKYAIQSIENGYTSHF
ncbi:MAG TPA: DUF3347 domain-containing protein [Parapedobacter sp.]|nr:DUF3347 domain-containing protein [Parapedobacter sp.]